MAYSVILEGGSPWGFRLQGGKEFNEPIKIAKLNPNSKAYNQGIKVGDYLNKINGTSTATLKHNDALQLIRSANNKLELELRRSDSVRKKTVIPEIRINGPTVNGTSTQTNGNLSDSDYYYSSCDEEGIVRTNAITNYHSSSGSAGSAGHLSDGDGSSSGSQSSVVHVVGPYKGPLADKMKNISNSGSSGPEPAAKEAGKAIPQTTVWSPFGVNKVRTYKPVSFSVIGRTTSPAASSSQSTAASSTFVNSSVSADVNTGAASTTTAAPTSARQECREAGQGTPSASQTPSAPTYSNFNGSSSVIVNSSTPASAYTSITMNSRKVPDASPTHQYVSLGSPVPDSGPSQSGPLSPTSPQGPVKSGSGPPSPVKSPFTKEYKPVSPPTPGGMQPPPPVQTMSPAGPTFRLASPPKPPGQGGRSTTPVAGPGSPAKSAEQPVSPNRPAFSSITVKSQSTKSPTGAVPSSPKGQPQQQRPTSPTKTVTFGPVTSLEDKPDEPDEPRLSVSQKKSLFEQRQQQQQQEAAQQARLQQLKATSPVTTPKRFGAPSAPKPFTAKGSPPSNITNAAGYRPVSPRLFAPSKPSAKPLNSPYAPPKSPPAKSKGLEMFLTLQRKLHDPDEELSEFTDSEDAPAPKPSTPMTSAKPVPASPVIGRAVPIKVTSQLRGEEQEPKDDLNLRTSSITKPLSGVGSPTTPVTTASEPWMPSKVSALIDAELKEREREREQQKEGQHKPATWGVSSSTEPNLTQYTALNAGSSETGSKSEPSLTKLGESFLWKQDQTTTFPSATVTTTTTTTMATHPTQSTTTSYSSHNGSLSHHAEPKLGLPTYQSPTITLLQKSREIRKLREQERLLSQNNEELKNDNFEIPPDIPAVRVDESEVPKEAILVGTKETIEGDKKHMDTYYLLPGDKEHSKSRRIVQRKTTKYEGIGPTDEATGVPIIPRGSVDEKAHKDWYRRMYKSLHKVERHEDVNTYKPTYVFPELETDSEVEEGTGSTMSMDRAGYGKKSFTLPHARYRETKYKVQPMSIENYEPGFSSIAFQERKVDREPARTADHQQLQQDKKPYAPPSSARDEKPSEKKSYLYNPPIEKPGQFSKYIYSDSEPELRKKEQPLSPQSDAESREAYRRIQKGGDIPYEGLHFPVPPKKEHVPTTTASDTPRQRHSVSGTGRSPTGSWDSRRRRDEEAARRKQEMKRITAQEKLKRMEEERKANEARRHNDFLTPSQKSPIPLNRYEDVPDISDLQRPKKKVGVQYRGKARALYNFKAQNPKELSFKKNDIIYLLRQIDKNWYEGEHHGLVGLFPVNYVEVLMSLDEARQAAIMREGRARAKYNFTAQSNMEVSFKKGDTVSLIRRIDNNWFEGRVDGKHGIFPVSYVEVLQEPDTPLPTPMSSYAPTPATGSPGQLSPVSTISNGPAPTIPSAPISPRSSVDNFDFGQPFSFSQYQPSTTTSLQRGTRRDHSYADYGLDPLNQMRPASALGGLTDGYGTMPRDRYNPANRPNSAVPFSDYMKTSTRDSGFYSSEESKYSRQKSREEELMRSLSNPYEGRQSSTSRDSFSRAEEPRYPPYQAMYSYRPQNPDELELREGDIVYVMEKCDDDWYVGTSQRTKEFGTFPGNYVRPL